MGSFFILSQLAEICPQYKIFSFNSISGLKECQILCETLWNPLRALREINLIRNRMENENEG